MVEAGAPDNLITVITEPTPDTTKALINHPDITMLVATGGPQIVNMVLSSGKKAIGAGSGNPPAVVDETADVAKAASDIVQEPASITTCRAPPRRKSSSSPKCCPSS